MKIEKVIIKSGRTIRHKPYVISEHHVELVAHIDPDEDLVEAVQELSDDVQFQLKAEMEIAVKNFEEEEHARKSKGKG